MYTLNKIVWAVANPLTIIWGMFGVGVICRRKGFVWAGLALLWIWSTPMTSYFLGASLERGFLVDGRVPRVESFPSANAIVLLGGGMGINTNVSDYAEMNAAADRVWQAARLYRAGKAPKIFITSVSCRENTQGLLNDLGVPDVAIVCGGMPAQNTEGEAKEMSRLLSGKILLVTSAWHMKRAKYFFEKYAQNLDVIPAPADFEASLAFCEGFSARDVLPSGSSLMWNGVYLHEWLGYFGYKWFR